MSLSPPQVALLTVLAAAQEPATQRAAEAQLDAYAAGFAGYATLLLSLLQPPAVAAVPAPLQTFAALLLKQHVHTHWSEGADNFVAPLVPDAEKQGLRQAMLPLLASTSRPLRRQIAAAITAVAEHDFPERWPGLLPDILGVLAQSQAAAAQGAQPSAEMSALLTGSMEVLVSFCEEMTDEQMTSAVPHLFPALLQLCQSKFGIVQQAQAAAAAAAPSAGGSAVGPELSEAQHTLLDDCVQFCIYSLQIYQSCCSSLLNINELMNDQAASMKVPKKKGQAAQPAPRDQILAQFLQPSLHQWLSLVASILTLPPAASAIQRLHLSISLPLLWGLRLEACKAALCIVEKFDDHLIRLGVPGAQVLAGLVELTIEAATTTWPLYQRKVLNARIDSDDSPDAAGDESGEEEAFDNEGNAINMSSFLFEAFTLLKALLHMRAPRKSAQAKKAAAGKKKGGAAPAAAPADPRQEAWSLLKSLFAGPLLPRLLEVAVQYLQLSSAEVAASLEHIDEFLAYQELDEDGAGGMIVGAKMNVRNGAKDLLLDCMLFGGGEEGKEAEDAEAAQLALMGFDIRGDGGAGAKGSSALLDRTLVIRTLCPILTGMLQQSSAMRAARNPHWWKGREVATMLVAYTVHEITTLNAPPNAKKGAQQQQQQPQVQFDLQGFIRDILIPDLSPQPQQQQAAGQGLPPAHVLLRTQALHATKHFAPVFERANESGLVLLALEALVSNMSPATNSDLLVRISSVHAFGDLCTTLQNKALITHGDLLIRALQNICQLVHSAATAPSAAALAAAARQGGPEAAKAAALAAEVDESALLKVLETLLMAITVDEKTTIAAEPTLTPLLLQAWSANATKPSISESIVDILENLLALSPQACISIQMAVLPALVQILQAEQRNVAVTGTVQAALDLLKAVLLSVEAHTRSQAALAAGAAGPASGAASPGSPGVPSALPEFLHPLLFSDLLPLVLALLMHTDDHSMLEVGTTVLTAYLRVDCNRVAGAQVSLVMPGSPAGSAPVTVGGLQLLCTLLNQFLNPSLDDKVAHNVGNLIVQFVFSLGGALGEANVKELMKAVVARLHSSHYPPLTESLLLVFARLIHSSGVESILRFLGGLGQIPVLNRVLTRVLKNPTDKYASEVRVDMVPSTVDALQYLLTRWMQSQSEIHASYPNKVLYAALIKLITFMFTPAAAGGGADDASRAALRNMECKGYVVEPAAPAKRASRSATAAGAKHEPEYRAVPLSTKVLMLLLAEWGEYNEKQRVAQKKAAKRLARASGAHNATGGAGDSDDSEDYDSEDDDEDYEDEEDDEDDFVAQMVARERANKARGGGGAGASGASPFADASDHPDLGAGSKKYLTLEEMMHSHAEAEEMDEELESEVYPEALTDPLAQWDLGAEIQKFLATFRQVGNGVCMQEAAQYLSPADRKLLDQALAAPPPPVQTTPQKKK